MAIPDAGTTVLLENTGERISVWSSSDIIIKIIKDLSDKPSTGRSLWF